MFVHIFCSPLEFIRGWLLGTKPWAQSPVISYEIRNGRSAITEGMSKNLISFRLVITVHSLLHTHLWPPPEMCYSPAQSLCWGLHPWPGTFPVTEHVGKFNALKSHSFLQVKQKVLRIFLVPYARSFIAFLGEARSSTPKLAAANKFISQSRCIGLLEKLGDAVKENLFTSFNCV
jgi:hypothetical protein